MVVETKYTTLCGNSYDNEKTAQEVDTKETTSALYAVKRVCHYLYPYCSDCNFYADRNCVYTVKPKDWHLGEVDLNADNDFKYNLIAFENNLDRQVSEVTKA
jgi:hypothetical protein